MECYIKIAGFLRVCDDNWDRDVVLNKNQFNNTFADLAFELSRNKFYQENMHAIQAAIFMSWNAWMDANAWHSSNDPLERNCAWFIRDYCNEMVMLFAWLVGGKEHARSISLEIRKVYLKRLSVGG